MGRRTGFVHQNDIHLDSSTVREALQLSARLRRPESISLEEKMTHVEVIIKLLEMEDIADAVIGVPGAGLNLERRKRVSIGVELAARPDILLFLDEPTSGLDGNSALSIVQLMRKLSNAGQTILCTIHQPSSQMIELFDSLLLLIPGGKTTYFGPLGPRCKKIIDYFARHTRPCRDTENPADYLLEVSSSTETDWFQVLKTIILNSYQPCLTFIFRNRFGRSPQSSWLHRSSFRIYSRRKKIPAYRGPIKRMRCLILSSSV
jgi:ABC-type multidrug transport system ATPase subunit